jgi:hypothetical protein
MEGIGEVLLAGHHFLLDGMGLEVRIAAFDGMTGFYTDELHLGRNADL